MKYKLGEMLTAAVVSAAAMMLCVAPAHADPPPPGCQRDPIFGLNPQIREVCDLAIQPDGSWTRLRQFSHPTFVHSNCSDGQYYGTTGYCPPWLTHYTIPAEQGPVETYVVTPDTIPAGEPGHIDS